MSDEDPCLIGSWIAGGDKFLMIWWWALSVANSLSVCTSANSFPLTHNSLWASALCNFPNDCHNVTWQLQWNGKETVTRYVHDHASFFFKRRVVNCQGRWWWCVWLVHEKENKVDKNLITGCPKKSDFFWKFSACMRNWLLCKPFRWGRRIILSFQLIDRLILTSQDHCMYQHQILTKRHICLYISVF